ncbi:NYN domain-containing protein [Planktotalea arctica]|uniref:LabA-like NYN domain-containing protein n=1 Tax=Planktotalea arctica TaxID=1481893 RepID=UPI000A176D49|nr:NYN domain-containing protein [Planktotalea arctica]
MFYKDETMAVLIDGTSLYAASRGLGFDIDYKMLRQEFVRRGKLRRICFYTTISESDEYSSMRPLADWLSYNGYQVECKMVKEYTDSLGHRKIKRQVVVDLAVGAMELASSVDHLVIFAGDGDLCPAIKSVQRSGVRVSVVSTIRTQPAIVSDELRRQADNFIDLDELKSVIARPAREPFANVMQKTSMETAE